MTINLKRVPAARRQAHAGFTLLEMLVAIALLAVIALLSWRGLDATIAGRNHIVGALAQTRELGRCFSQLQYDALNLVTPQEVFGPPLRMKPDELVMIRHLDVGAAPTRLQVIRYRLKGRQLLRSASPPLASLSQLTDALQHMDNFASIVVSDQVHTMHVSVWLAPGGWTDQQSTIADAYAHFLATRDIGTITAIALPLPRGLRFSIDTTAPVRAYERTIPIGR